VSQVQASAPRLPSACQAGLELVIQMVNRLRQVSVAEAKAQLSSLLDSVATIRALRDEAAP